MHNHLHILTRFYRSSFPKLVSLVLCLIPFSMALAQTPHQLNTRTKQQIAVLLQEKAARTPVQQKINTQLILAAKQRRDGFINRSVPTLKPSMDLQPDGRAMVDIDAAVSDDLLAFIEKNGGGIINNVPEENAIRAVLPLVSVELVAARNDVRFIRPAVGFVTNTGSVTSKGDVAHRSNLARSTYGATGAGIKVGLLSDSIDDNVGSFAAAKASGDIDASHITVLSGQAGTGEGEGLAMLEIVHDLAPAAPLYFATGNGSPAIMAQNIRSLATAGCRVIIDDLTYYNESPFQDGPIAKAVNDVSAQNVLYFSSAANSGNKNDGTSGTWEGDFVDGGDASLYDGAGSRFHLFAAGNVADSVTSKGNRTMLYWSDPLGGSNNDYDLFVVDFSGNVVSSSLDTQNGTQDPIEGVDPADVGQYAVIVKFSGAARFLHLDTNRGKLEVNTAGNTRGHNASGAANAFCVAATSASNQNTPFTGGAANPVETFSSDGYRRIFFNANGTAITPGNFSSTGGKVLLKPDITAADGVATTLPQGGGLNPFFGTSAAAPHAGAIAAQILSYRPTLTPAQVRAALKTSCLNIEAAGFDRDSGSGIVMALAALQSLGPAWNAVGAGDFNADGKADILWENVSGARAIWLMNGTTLRSVAALPTVSPSWSIVGSGDFNADHKIDILWQSTSGAHAVWLMNGTTLKSVATLPMAAPSWRIVGSGDFNSDSKADILWQNAAGARAVWLMNGTTLRSVAALPMAAPSWNIVGAGDFNADGKTDILWQSTAGARAIWLMNGTSFRSSVSLPNGPTSWDIVGAGDFNSDHKTDILWQSTSGAHAVWLMNGTTLRTVATLPTVH